MMVEKIDNLVGGDIYIYIYFKMAAIVLRDGGFPKIKLGHHSRNLFCGFLEFITI